MKYIYLGVLTCGINTPELRPRVRPRYEESEEATVRRLISPKFVLDIRLDQDFIPVLLVCCAYFTGIV